jgi:hypothetical protein
MLIFSEICTAKIKIFSDIKKIQVILLRFNIIYTYLCSEIYKYIYMEKDCKTVTKQGNIREFFKSWYFWKPFLGILGGGLLGFLYYHFVGCTSGSCFITSHSYSSMIFGGLLGFLITSGPCSRC